MTSTPEIEDRPRSMRDPAVQVRRKAMLGMGHVAPLTAYVARLNHQGLGEVPNFDPLDGGVEAQALFLLEKPGRMTSETGERLGSGFISRNNDDPTAEAIFKFMRDIHLPRTQTVIWNVVPWWNGKRKITTKELHDGVEYVQELICLLPKLQVVMFVGAKAARAKSLLAGGRLALYSSCHPSPIVKASARKKWEDIPAEWAKVLPHLTDHR